MYRISVIRQRGHKRDGRLWEFWSDTAESGRRHCGERKEGGRRVDNSAAKGDLKTSEKKVTLKGQVKPFASTL